MRFETWNSIIQLSVGFILAIPTLFFQVRMIFARGSDKRISNHLRMNIGMWILVSIVNLIYTGHFLVFFRGEGTLYRVQIITYVGAINFSLLTSLSLSVFFLLIDRCFIIILPIYYNTRFKLPFEIFCFLAVIVNFGVVFGSHLYTGLSPGHYTTCLSAGCVPNPNRNTISISAKFIYGVCNTLTALIFALIFLRYRRKHFLTNSRTKRANVAAICSIISELLCSVFPNFAVLVAFNVFHLGIVQSLGPFVNTLSSIDGFFVTISYIKILGYDIGLSGWKINPSSNGKTISLVKT